ncbi:release factor glutamine methyltransferase [Dokdonella fugitiva]|uniref:Release factor glutamine methyltransferase n=1 Tax=Dokdonella fugitiva TaxID=328517 RepID=A0A4R2ID50_9GAMM|nr:release factor glutamine methyltransferase [Dokdonella fugitiva]TCO41699.1 release factor glutamine methyltransferase [Dokdonella fugitiva]
MRALLADAAARLGGDDARGEVELLLAHVLGRTRAWLFAWPEHEASAEQAGAFERLVEARRGGAPVAYLLGRRGFWSFDLAVSPAVLIPRPETELLVELALERIPSGEDCALADLGTGSGAIALALAHERPHARVVATDASAAALAVAHANAQRLGIGNVRFVRGDWYAPLTASRFALVASNPPYIAADDPHLARGDLRHEPLSALASGHDGLDAIRTIIADTPAHLLPDGWLLIEHGWEQGAAVRQLFQRHGFDDVQSVRDVAGHERVTLGRRGA